MTTGLSPQELYQQRLKRFNDAVSLRVPDRVPIAGVIHYFMTKAAGLTNKEVWYEPERAAEAIKETTFRLGWDMAPMPSQVMYPRATWEKLGFGLFKWPGQGLADDVSHQWVEKEYLLAEEYDDFLRNPGDFTVRKLLPRVATELAPFAMLPPLHTLFPLFYPFLPYVAGAMQAMVEAAAEYEKYAALQAKLARELEEAGFPMLAVALCVAPFDQVSDFMRGMRGTMLDMYRCPDKLLAAIDLYTDLTIASTIAWAQMAGNPRVVIPLHRGAAGFMSNQQFARFYWPSLKKLLLALIDAGLTPLVAFEGDYTPRLEFLAELPPGKVLGVFDTVDLKKYKKILGNTMCFWGNVPAQMLVTGTPGEVKDYVRMLIDLFGDTGGLVVAGALCGVPDESKPENVDAMTEAVFQYGQYRKG